MRRKRKILLLASMIMILSAVALDAYEVFSGQNPGSGTVISDRGTFSVPNGKLVPLNAQAATYFNATGVVSNNTIAFDVLGAEQSEPASGLVYTVSTNATMTVTYRGAMPSVVNCGSCSAIYNGAREVITFSGVFSGNLVVIWTPQGFRSEAPSTLFKDTFLYTNPYLTNAWTFDRYGAFDPTAQAQGGIFSFTSVSSVPAQTVHVTTYAGGASSSFNPASLPPDNTIIKRKLTVALTPFAIKTGPTASLSIGLSPLTTIGAFPGSAPYGTPSAVSNNACTASNNVGSAYIYTDNSGYMEGHICGDPSGSNNFYPLYTGNPTLFTVFTVETRGVFCSTCADNALLGSQWVFFRVYQQDKSGNIIAASDNSLNVTSLNSGSLAPFATTTYIFVGQRNSSVSGVVSKIALVDLQNFGSPVILPPPPSNIPFPTCGTLACPGIQPLIVMFSNWAGNGNAQLGAMILYFVMMSLTAFGVAVKSRATIPAITVSVLITLMFIYGGFLPTFLDFIMLFGAGLLIALTVLSFVGIGLGARQSSQTGDDR